MCKVIKKKVASKRAQTIFSEKKFYRCRRRCRRYFGRSLPTVCCWRAMIFSVFISFVSGKKHFFSIPKNERSDSYRHEHRRMWVQSSGSWLLLANNLCKCFRYALLSCDITSDVFSIVITERGHEKRNVSCNDEAFFDCQICSLVIHVHSHTTDVCACHFSELLLYWNSIDRYICLFHSSYGIWLFPFAFEKYISTSDVRP